MCRFCLREFTIRSGAQPMYQFLKFRVLFLLLRRFMRHRAHPRDRIDASFHEMCSVSHNSKSFMCADMFLDHISSSSSTKTLAIGRFCMVGFFNFLAQPKTSSRIAHLGEHMCGVFPKEGIGPTLKTDGVPCLQVNGEFPLVLYLLLQ